MCEVPTTMCNWKSRPEYSRKGEQSLLHWVLFIPTENQCTKLQIGMQPAELLYVPKSRLMIHFHAYFISYYILLWQLFYVPFLSCMYTRCPFSLSSFSLFLAATKQLYKWYFPSVCLSVRPSVRLSHLFDYVPIIVSSSNFQELLLMTKVRSMQKDKVKGQGHRDHDPT